MDIKSIALAATAIAFSINANAVTINFDFTGQLTIGSYGRADASYPISASLSYDTVAGIGSSDLTISTGSQTFFGFPMIFHDIDMQRVGNTNIIVGSILTDWNVNHNMPLHIEWDATGLFNAIDYGLQPGHVLSGSTLYYDTNGNGVQNQGEYLADINSAIPYADSLFSQQSIQGPAPMAATVNSQGLDETTPFQGIIGLFDIGSGNSMHVTSVSAVPIPSAIWLFGSGLIGLVGLARRKANA